MNEKSSTGVRISLPELSDVLQSAIQENTLVTYHTTFAAECAQHLKSIVARPSRKQYGEYCRMLVEKYPVFRTDGASKPWVRRSLI